MPRVSVRRLVPVLALAVACVLPLAAAGAPGQHQSGGVAIGTLESGVLADINAMRRNHGLAPLRLSVPLTAAARQHSTSMALKGYFSHSSADGTSFAARLRHYYATARYRSWVIGENLVWASPDLGPAEALKLWMNSPEHRANLLSRSWREIGVSAVHVFSAPGVYGGSEVTIITTDFGSRS
jgi:uncharacterized protein YkwD